MADFLVSCPGTVTALPQYILSYSEYRVNPSCCAHLLPNGWSCWHNRINLICIQSSQVAPSPVVHLIVFLVDAFLCYIAICIILSGILGRKATIFFSLCLSLLVCMSLYKALWRKYRLGLRNSCVLVAEGLTWVVCYQASHLILGWLSLL